MLACAQRVSGKGQPKQITNAINPCEASTPSLSHAAQRLRSTMRSSEQPVSDLVSGRGFIGWLSLSLGR